MNGSSIVFPKNLNKSAGVAKIPIKLEITVLHKAVATLPPEAVVNKIHILIVVGKQVNINRPSSNGLGSSDGKNDSMPRVSGTPIKKGQAINVISCIEVLSFILAAAFVNSDNLRLSPEIRKIVITPYFPINSSGCSMLPFLPSL